MLFIRLSVATLMCLLARGARSFLEAFQPILFGSVFALYAIYAFATGTINHDYLQNELSEDRVIATQGILRTVGEDGFATTYYVDDRTFQSYPWSEKRDFNPSAEFLRHRLENRCVRLIHTADNQIVWAGVRNDTQENCAMPEAS